MLRHAIAAVLLCTSGALSGAQRAIGVGSFDRVRVDGGFDVRITTGRSPRATLSGDQQALDRVDLRVDGTTLTLRRRSDDARTARLAMSPVIVTLSAQTLSAATMLGGGRISIDRVRGDRVDLAVAGTGAIAVAGMDARLANASVVGGGAMTLAGSADRVRLTTNGAGSIDAADLVADDLVVRLDGLGEIRANARHLASVSTTGLGRVAVTGNAKCTVRAPDGGAVTCGAP
jgi:hypothetical protein